MPRKLVRAVWINEKSQIEKGELIDYDTALDEVQHLRELDRFAWLEDAESQKVEES